jgi:hypothetical protein
LLTSGPARDLSAAEELGCALAAKVKETLAIVQRVRGR